MLVRTKLIKNIQVETQMEQGSFPKKQEEEQVQEMEMSIPSRG